jgi:UDP-N-acetylmuramate--alanine ligase
VDGVEVIDDFAHNPDKIAAALAAARDRTSGRVLAVFQPHGFGPTRFLREALVETFVTELRAEDVLWLPEIYFAGGTVTRDISAADLVRGVAGAGRDARFRASRSDLPALVAAEARPGDLVLVMGARDPGLTGFCREIIAALGSR